MFPGGSKGNIGKKRVKKAFGLKQMMMIILKFCFCFSLQYVLIITFYGFDLNFLKIILKRTLYGLLQGKVYLIFSIILKQNDYPFPILK